jgi:hypothetical protein
MPSTLIESEGKLVSVAAIESDELNRLSDHTKEVFTQLKTAMAKRTGRAA